MNADDTQIYITFDPPNGAEAVARLNKCIDDVSEWMLKNFLKLNNIKTEFTVIGSKHNLKDLENVTEVGDTTVRYSKSVRNIGAIFDSQPNMTGFIIGD